MRRRVLIAAIGGLLAASPAAAASPSSPVPRPADLRGDLARSRAEQLRAAREYKASLEHLLVLREADVQRALEQVERSRELLERGIIARKDLEAKEQAAADARARLDQTWNEALVAASLIAKALAYDELASAPPLPPGGEQVTASLVRYRGPRPWTLALTRSLEEFYARAFGRSLPVSAYGQTPVHDRLGFDHRNAVDIAVHPDSAEGRAVMDWLRRAGLSFIAFRAAVPGAATGAHIHIGEPSQRLASP
jgi:hypothetical protein